MPSLDVVIPCYNYGGFLERSVRSALNQADVDVRVLIIDDHSSDDTKIVGRRLAEEDSRIEFRRHDENMGFISTINEGIVGWARAEFSLLLSADDALVAGAFRRAKGVFEQAPEIGLVYGMARVIAHDGTQSFPLHDDGETAVVSGLEFLEHCCLTGTNPVPSPTAFVRTDIQHRLGGYRKDMPHTCDLEMWMRFAASGPVGVVRSVQGEYRVHERNMSRMYLSKAIGDRKERAHAFREAITPIAAVHPKSAILLQRLQEGMLDEAFRNAIHEFICGDVDRAKAWANFFAELVSESGIPRHQHRILLRELTTSRFWRLFRSARGILGAGDPRLSVSHEEWELKHGDTFGWWPPQGA